VIESSIHKSSTYKVQKIEVLESKLLSNPLHNSPRLPDLYNKYSSRVELTKKIKQLKKQITEALSVMHLDELKCRKRVLRRLGFTNEADIIQLKARVACEISTGDELCLSELMFNGFFNDIGPEQMAAVLSCFIFEEKSKEAKDLSPDMAKLHAQVIAQAKTIVRVSQESKLPMDEKAYTDAFKPELMEVTLAWCKGASFAEIW
jgi:ATP-dependent RNA helicase DOB1